MANYNQRNKKEYINDYLYRKFLLLSTESQDAGELADAVTDDVVTDIEETAGDDWNSGDVDIALVRVLKKRLGIED